MIVCWTMADARGILATGRFRYFDRQIVSMQNHDSLSRRDFNRLTSAALGGLLSGAMLGCQEGGPAPAAEKDLHVCRGLNQCQTAANECAGQGQCATFPHHACGRHHECKGQAGCGATPGENDCKGKGGCAVPLADHAWAGARENFEQRMKGAGKKFGPAPPAEKKSS